MMPNSWAKTQSYWAKKSGFFILELSFSKDLKSKQILEDQYKLMLWIDSYLII